MVEGSQVDWAAHYNDPYAAVTDFLEFDKAVGRAIDFAKKDSHTVVIVCPDHSTGGLSVGNFQSGTDILGKSQDKYENINIRERIVDSLAKIRWSGRKLAEKMLSDRSYVSADSIFNYYHLMPSKELMAAFDSVSKIKTQESLVDTLQQMLGSAFSRRHFIGWTTTGHTAEDVFLAICAPRGIERKMGVIENGEVGKYIASLLCLGNLIDSTRKYFCSHKELFSAGEVTVSPDSLVISRNNRKGVVKKNTTILRLDGKEVRLPTIAVFINEVYYVPKKITDYFK
jgi:alkaline phosphatase